MLCPDPSKRASIPDILSHRWMRSESYIRRVSFPQPAPSAGLAEDTFASIAQILQPPNPTEGRLNELSVPVSSCSDGFASYHSPDSRLFNPTEDPSFSTLLRVEVDVAAAATAATTAATTITKSVLPSDGSLSNSSYDTQSDASSTWNCRSFSIDNTADVSGFSMSQCSAISHKSNGGSVRMRSPRGHLISDSHSGAPSTSWHTVETSFSVSSLNTPMATPGATPRLGSLYQDGGHCESMSAESSQSEKVIAGIRRQIRIGIGIGTG